MLWMIAGYVVCIPLMAGVLTAVDVRASRIKPRSAPFTTTELFGWSIFWPLALVIGSIGIARGIVQKVCK